MRSRAIHFEGQKDIAPIELWARAISISVGCGHSELLALLHTYKILWST